MSLCKILVNGEAKPVGALPYVKFSGTANFYVVVNISGNPGCTNSAVSVMSFSRPEGTLIAARHTWQKSAKDKSTKILNNSNYNFCSIRDLDAVIDLTITPIEEGFYGEFYLNYGPIVLDPEVIEKFEEVKLLKSHSFTAQGEFNFTEDKVEMVEVGPEGVKGLNSMMQEVGSLPITSDLLVIAVPNSNRKIKVFNAEKTEFTVNFRIEDEKDLFMLLVDHWKGKQAVRAKELAKNESISKAVGEKLFDGLDTIATKNPLLYQRLPTDIIDLHQDMSLNQSLDALTNLMRENSQKKAMEMPFDNSPSFETHKITPVGNFNMVKKATAEVQKPAPQEEPFQQTPSLQKMNTAVTAHFSQPEPQAAQISFQQKQPEVAPEPSIRSVFRTVKLIKPEEMPKFDPLAQSKIHQSIHLQSKVEPSLKEFGSPTNPSQHSINYEMASSKFRKPTLTSLKKTEPQLPQFPSNGTMTHPEQAPMRISLAQQEVRSKIADQASFQSIKKPSLAGRDLAHSAQTVPTAIRQTASLSSPVQIGSAFKKNDDATSVHQMRLMKTSQLPQPRSLQDKIVENIIGENEGLAYQNKNLQEEVGQLRQQLAEIESELRVAKAEVQSRPTVDSKSAESAKAIEDQIFVETEKKRRELLAKEEELKAKQTALDQEAVEKKKTSLQLVELRFNFAKLEKEMAALKQENVTLAAKLKVAESAEQNLSKEFSKEAEQLRKKDAEEAAKKIQNAIAAQKRAEDDRQALDTIVLDLMQKMKEKDDTIWELKKKSENAKEEAIKTLTINSQKNDSGFSHPSNRDSRSNTQSIMDKYESLSQKYDETRLVARKGEEERGVLVRENKQLSAENSILRQKLTENRPVGERALTEQVSSLLFDKNQLENELNLSVQMIRQYEDEANSARNQRDTITRAKAELEQTVRSQLSKMETQIHSLEVKLKETEFELDQKTQAQNHVTKGLESLLGWLKSSQVSLNFDLLPDHFKQVFDSLPDKVEDDGFSPPLLDFKLLAQQLSVEKDQKVQEVAFQLQESQKFNLVLGAQVDDLKKRIAELESAKPALPEPVEAIVSKQIDPISRPAPETLRRNHSMRSAEEEFYSLNDEINDEIILQEMEQRKVNVTVEVPKLEAFVDEVVRTMLPRADKILAQTLFEKIDFIRANLKKLVCNWVKIKKMTKQLKAKQLSLEDENETLNLKLQDVKKRRKELIDFVRAKMMPKDEQN